ncbi:amino acid adenylation domain-containing protein [Flavobacterium sp. FlaQc-50]|uniref:amino acid adenylation domain-containing protein n=1 Tax=unclassified Flavobacterium TaxID=196869 RepID=UPI0037578D1E
MEIIELIKEITDHQISLTLDGDDLQISFDGDQLDPNIISKLKEHKAELVAYFKKYASAKKFEEIKKIEAQESYALSHSQKRLWVSSQFEGVSEAYNMPASIELKGDYDIEKFKKAIVSVIEKHEILRTVFRKNDNDEIRQWVLPVTELNFVINYKDFSDKPDQLEVIADYIQEDSYKKFDLENGPLLRVSIFKTSGNEYTFYYNMHHIISDGWSMGVLAKDVLNHYKLYASGRENEIEKMEIQYKDYAEWQLQQLAKPDATHKDYWGSVFFEELPRINLPSGKKRPLLKTHNGASIETYLSKPLTEKLKQFSNDNKGSLFITLLGILDVLIYSYTNINDIVIGAPVAGRNHSALENQIGFYVNTLALRNKIDAQHSFKEFYEEVKKNTLQAFLHQEYPFDLLIEDLNLTKDVSRSPLFDIMLILQNTGDDTGEMFEEKNSIDIESKNLCKVLFDIEFHFSETDGHLFLKAVYNTDLYEEDMIKTLIGHFKRISELVVCSNDPIEKLDFLSAEEKNEQLVLFNNVKNKSTLSKSIVDVIEEIAKEFPDEMAISDKDTKLNYSEFNKISNQFSSYLIEQFNVQPNDFIGIKLAQGHWAIIAIFSALKANGAYVPIDVNYPIERIDFIENDAQCKVIIDDKVIEEFITRKTSYSDENRILNIKPSDLAYVIYTSGSTGKPKGVLISHKNLMHSNNARIQAYEKVNAFLLLSSIAFDSSIAGIFGTLSVGGKLCIPPADMLEDIEYLTDFIRKEKVSHFLTVPSYLKILLQPLSQMNNDLKEIIVAGELCHTSLVDEFHAVKTLSDCTLFNEYGPTECTVWSSVYKYNRNEPVISTIGKPIGNTKVYLLNKEQRLIPKGAIGELYISGEGVAQGYLNRPELTSEKFIESPFEKGVKLYRTGDVAIWLYDGNIEFLGRADNQVKIRGYRIELGEIESYIRQIEGIREVVVLVKKGVANQEELFAYIVADRAFNVAEIRNFLIDRVPNYMIPAHYQQFEKFPLTPNGKIDTKKLQQLHENQLSIKVDYIAPRNTKEEVLVTICQEVLKHKQISVKNSFYELGGDSIKSIQIVSRLKQAGYTLKVEQILRNPVIENLALLLTSSVTIINQKEVVGESPLTPIQHYLFENPNVNAPQHYNQSVLLKSESRIKSIVLQDCIHKLLEHHDALRIVFKEENGKRIQYNNPFDVRDYIVIDHDLTTYENPLDEMTAVSEKLQKSFNLTNGPLLKVAHFKMNDGDRLAIIVHHLVIDAVSWRILIEDLLTLYNQAEKNEKLVLPLKTNSFQQWALSQQKHAYSKKMINEASYWSTLSQEKAARIKTDYKINESAAALENQFTFSLDRQTTELLQTKFHKVYTTEINDVLLTGLALAIKEVFEQDRTIIKMEGHGREDIIEDIDVSRTIGWFTTEYPLILDISNTEEDIDSLIKVKENIRKIPAKGIGFGILKYLNEDYGALEINSSISFNYLGDFDNSFSENFQSDFSYSSESIGDNIAKENSDISLLSITGSTESGKLSMTIMYSDLMYSHDTIKKLSEAYQEKLLLLIEKVSKKNETYKTPSDLLFKELTVNELSQIKSTQTIENVYELSPLQQGIYYHWLTSKSNSLYFEQISYRLQIKNIEISEVHEAYKKLVERHSVLRTGFINNITDIPLQVVRKEVAANFYFEKLPASIKERNIDDYVKQFKLKDREEGFILSDSSLMRLKVLDLGNNYYEFVWSHHHILMDGWCMSILINDFNQLLMGISGNSTVNMTEPKPYSEYIHWLRSVDTDESMGYWKNYLEDYNTVAILPFVKDLAQSTYTEGTQSLKIEGELFTKMQTLCNSAAITQSTFLQSVWGYLLSKYNNTNDVVFGAVVSGRPADLSEIEDMIGLFINTIPIRIKHQEKDTPLTLLKRMQQMAIDSNAHHYQNLAKVQSQSELGTELINHIMIFENFPIQEAVKESASLINRSDESDQNLFVEAIEVFEQTNYDFNLMVLPSTTSMRIDFKFNSEKYDAASIEKLSRHLFNVIEQFATLENKYLTEIDCLLDDDRDLILNVFNATAVNYEEDKTVLDLFKECVSEFPDHTAVSYQDTIISYQQLDVLTDQLSYYLCENFEVQSNDLVGIKLERSQKMLIAILGVLKSGAGYVPIDTHYPETRLEYIKSDSSYKICIDDAVLEIFEREKSNSKIPAVQRTVSGTNIAYAIYTSGSTGNPKGVLNDHSGLYNRLLWMRDDLKISSKDVILQKTPYTFDVSVWELLMPSITGCELVFAQPEGHKDPAYLQEIIAEKQVTVMHFVPSMLGIFLEELDPSKCKSLRHVVCSGEALPGVMVEEFKQKLPWVRIHNLYGPTEAAIDVTSIDLTEVDTKRAGVTIGKPVANTKIYIVNKQMSLQPVGIPGELLIEGIQVARGYLNNPELNSDRFIPSPFNSQKRAYRTGDLAKWLPNGEISYLGRIDNQVKIRGNRIELGEIETRIQEFDYVEHVAVLVKGDSTLRKYLVAYVISKPGYTQELLFDHLKDSLPDYMIPSRIIELDSFPLTNSGKLNRKALSDLEEETAVSSYEAPRNEMESELVSIWEEVLNQNKIGIRDNFFWIGGDSILSIRLISKINKKFDVSLTIAQLYEFNTVEALRTQIEKDVYSSKHKQFIKKEIEDKIDLIKEKVLTEISCPETIEDVYPMSDIQKGMVILSSLNSGTGIYHDQFVFQIPTVNTERFQEAFSMLIWKHASLRSRFDLTTYEYEVQIVEKEIEFAIDYQDIKELGTKEKEDYIKRYMVSERQNTFSMESGLLWRISLFQISETATIFLFQFHHAILDGWSMATLNTELFQIYRDLTNSTTPKFEKLKSTNRDAIIEELYEKNNQENISFWQEELADYKRLDIFKSENANEHFEKVYDFDFKYKLEEKCKKDGVSIKTAIYAAFIHVLKIMNYEEDFVIGMVTNNRPVIEDGEKILGCFLNTIPVRNRLENSHNLTWSDYFRNTENQLTAIKKNERLTLYEISKVTNEETLGGSPFFDVLVNYVDFHVYNELELETDESFVKSREFDFNVKSFEATNTVFDLNINLSGHELKLGYALKRGLKLDITLEKIHSLIDEILSIYLNLPNQKLSETNLSIDDRDLILNVFNATAVNYEEDKTVLDLFKECVSEFPDHTAVSYQDTIISYQQLDVLTDQLSYYLCENFEVQPNDLVGIKLERSQKMLIAILGVLKSGAGYVPIDTHYPETRLEYIKSDSSYKICIDDAVLEIFEREKSNSKIPAVQRTVSGTNIAYAIYTSGSTGNPKGVLNDHSGLYNRLLWMRDDLKISSKDVILQKTPYTFDVSVWELLMPSITGCELVFAQPEGHKDPAYLQEIIAEKQVTVMHFVPSMLGIFLEELDPSKCKSLRHVVCSGEALPGVMVEEFKQKLPWVRIHNLYGPTEAAIDVTSIDLTEVDTKRVGVTIGKPVANTKIYIVNKQMSLQPVGIPGELLIEGIQVARGYLNNPELNSDRFIPSPFNSQKRAYRTGDLAKWLPNGEISYLGRIDNQVKIRGNRIELGEIETRIQEFDYVEHVAVLVKGDSTLRKYLVAYVISKSGYTQELLFDHLKDSLPDYMIPSRIVELDSFPLTNSGKLNRKALSDLEEETAVSSYEAPRNEMESELVLIWEEVLKQNKIGIRDNFFWIGGDSILSIRLISKINKKFDVSLTIAQLYEFNTISDLTDQIKNNVNSSEEHEIVREDILMSFDKLREEIM